MNLLVLRFLIFTGGELDLGRATKSALNNFDKVIAVDSGVSHCLRLKLTPDFLVGDFDSIDKKIYTKIKSAKAKILKFPRDKDVTDTELALDHALKWGATDITILAGISGARTDHLLGNILLLLKNKYSRTSIKFVNGNQEIYIARNQIKIEGKKDDLVSLIPIDDTVKNMKSTGLKYDLSKYTISIQGNHGISNVITQNTATAQFKNQTLLIIHTQSN